MYMHVYGYILEKAGPSYYHDRWASRVEAFPKALLHLGSYT